MRWVLLFEVLPILAWDKPVTIYDVYACVLAREKQLQLKISLRELREIIEDFERRNIVKFVDKSRIMFMLTEDAKYFLIIYRPHGV